MKKQGFVMVESVLWLAALAVLAAIVLPNALKYVKTTEPKCADYSCAIYEINSLNTAGSIKDATL